MDAARTPAELRAVLRSWNRAGRPPQAPIAWNRALWTARFGGHAPLLRSLPERLGRRELAAAGRRIRDPSTALDAFLVTMIWGFGFTGYGAFRVQRMIDANDGSEVLGEELLDVADECREEGGLAAFRAIARRRTRQRSYLAHLGPAFGTKYLFACTTAVATAERPATPIMDALVRNWFRRAAGIPLVIERWHADSYRLFLDTVTTWGDELGSTPEDVEALIFADETAATGSPWRQSWWPRPAIVLPVRDT